MTDIVVLGSGMGGFGATHQLGLEGIRPVVFEKNAHHGGHTSSYVGKGGFLFDFGPHISFTEDCRIQDLFAGYVEQEYESLQVQLDNYWRGYRLTHPVQLHLNGLPEELIVEIITEFVDEQSRPDRSINNYEDWLIASYGKKFAELFPMQYTRKYHTTSACNMSTDWLGPRMYRQSLAEMLKGALSPGKSDVAHYVSKFRYPTRGGFASYQKTFPDGADIRLGHELVALDPKRKELQFSNRTTNTYDGVVSSIPLPELIPLITGTPADVVAAVEKLACSTCVLVNVGVDRADLSEAHMTYFYDEDVRFNRLSFPHMLSATNVPEGCGSVQAEVYFSKKYRPLTVAPEDLVEPVIRDLIRAGVLRDDDEILYRGARVMQYANVIFDLERSAALGIVHGYLDDVGISYCGRYGDWDYMWTDESFTSGERAARTALSRSRC